MINIFHIKCLDDYLPLRIQLFLFSFLYFLYFQTLLNCLHLLYELHFAITELAYMATGLSMVEVEDFLFECGLALDA